MELLSYSNAPSSTFTKNLVGNFFVVPNSDMEMGPDPNNINYNTQYSEENVTYFEQDSITALNAPSNAFMHGHVRYDQFKNNEALYDGGMHPAYAHTEDYNNNQEIVNQEIVRSTLTSPLHDASVMYETEIKQENFNPVAVNPIPVNVAGDVPTDDLSSIRSEVMSRLIRQSISREMALEPDLSAEVLLSDNSCEITHVADAPEPMRHNISQQHISPDIPVQLDMAGQSLGPELGRNLAQNLAQNGGPDLSAVLSPANTEMTPQFPQLPQSAIKKYPDVTTMLNSNISIAAPLVEATFVDLKVCSVCGKRITRDMIRHMRTHQTNKRFACMFPKGECRHTSRQFNRRYDFKKHLLNKHFVFDNPGVRKVLTLSGKLGDWGTCPCGRRFLSGDWLQNHILTSDPAARCPAMS